MKIYHVTTAKKLNKYLKNGFIKPPVRAWKDIKEAERFSCQTGRKIILRLKNNNTFTKLEGHKGLAVISNSHYEMGGE